VNLYKIFLCIGILFIAQIVTWFQMFGQFKYSFFRDNILLVCVTGIPITLMYYYSTKYGVEGFGNSWSLRIMQFVMGIIIFTFLNYQLLGEGINTKNTICLGLCFLIVLIQAFWK
jgi:hypothetical protein